MPKLESMRDRVLSYFGCRKGSAAVEFALVAPIFLVLVLVFVEVVVIMLEQTLLDSVTNSVQRLVLTGNYGAGYTTGTTGQANTPQTAVETAICQSFITVLGGTVNGNWPVSPNIPIFPNCTCSRTQNIGGVTSCLYYSFPTVQGFRYCVFTGSNFAGVMSGGQAPVCNSTTWSPATAWSPATSASTMPTGGASVVVRIEYDHVVVTPALNNIGTGILTLYGINAAQIGT